MPKLDKTKAWTEFKAFTKYIKEYFPGIETLTIYGSILYSDSPQDVDIFYTGKSYIKTAYKMLFPNIHLIKNDPFRFTNIRGVTILAWTKKSGLIINIIPDMTEDHYKMELINLRQQVKELRKKADDTETERRLESRRTAWYARAY